MHKRTIIAASTGCVVLFVVFSVLATQSVIKLWREHGPDLSLPDVVTHHPAIREEQLEAWGDEVVERVREIANSEQADSIDLRTYGYLVRLNEHAADELLIEILSGATEASPEDAVQGIYYGSPGRTQAGSRIMGSEAFKQAALSLADSESEHARGILASLAGDLAWTEAVPELRRLTADKNLDVREKAAKSIRELTGKRVGIARPPVRFPQNGAQTNWLALPRSMTEATLRGLQRIVYLDWFGGTPTRAMTIGQQIIAVDPDDRESGSLTSSHRVVNAFSVPREDGSIQIITSGRNSDGWIAIDEQGAVLWRLPLEIGLACVLHDSTGPSGLVVEGEEADLRGLDANGTELWRTENGHVVHALATHPDVPNWVLSINGARVRFFEVAEGRAQSKVDWKARDLYVTEGTLVPDSSGAPLAILGGSRDDDATPLLVALDAKGTVVWKAELPSAADKLFHVEPTGAPKRIAAVTKQGGIYLFDAEGTLYEEARVPRSETDDDLTMFDSCAGAESNGAWTLSVRSTAGTHIFDVVP